MGLFDKLFDKKNEVQNNNNESNEMSNANNNTALEKMMSEDDCYSEEKTIKILTELQKAELFQFTDEPVEGEQLKYKTLTFTPQINNQPTRLVAVFTNPMAMRTIMNNQKFFMATSDGIFDAISSKILQDANLGGIIVNPQQQNYIITKDTLVNWNNYKLKLQNEQLLKLIEEKISSSDLRIPDNYLEIIDLLKKALLPMPIKKDSNGKENIHINMNKAEDDKIWLCIFTNSNDLINYMKEKVEIHYLPRVVERFAMDVINSNYAGIVVNLTGKQFVIPARVCNTIALSNISHNENWLKRIEGKMASPESELTV